MRYAIISDVHSNLEALGAVLKDIDSRSVERVVCLGDVVGYNANPNECCDILQERGIPSILGNHDAVACSIDEPWGFNPVAMTAAMWTREALSEANLAWMKALPDALNLGAFVGVHGAPKNRNTYLFSWEDILPHLPFMEEQNTSVCMMGHTHSPGIFSTDGVYTVDDDARFEVGEGKVFFINPGSVGQPRDGDPRAAYGIMDTEANVFEQVRVEYPVQDTAKRVVDAGLPGFLAERLFLGR